MRADIVVSFLLEEEEDPKEFLARNDWSKLYPENAVIIKRLKKLGLRIVRVEGERIEAVYAGKKPSYHKGAWFLHKNLTTHNSLMYSDPWREWAVQMGKRIQNVLGSLAIAYAVDSEGRAVRDTGRHGDISSTDDYRFYITRK